MKTTLVIDDLVMTRVRECAAREGRTISELVESALRLLLDRSAPQVSLPPLPRFQGGAMQIDVADREALYRIFDDENQAAFAMTAREPEVGYGRKTTQGSKRGRKKRSA